MIMIILNFMKKTIKINLSLDYNLVIKKLNDKKAIIRLLLIIKW